MTDPASPQANTARQEMQHVAAPSNAIAPHPHHLDEAAAVDADADVNEKAISPAHTPYTRYFENDDPTWLKPHTTRLPTALYLLSFAPPFRSAFSSPRAFVSHPYVLYFIGTCAALAAGASVPALDIMYGYWTNGITQPAVTTQDIRARSNQVGWIMTLCGIGSVCCSWLFLVCFSTAAHNLTVRLRHTYVASVLIQDQTFFDIIGPGEISARAGKDITTIRVGLGEKIAYFTWSISTLLVGIISSFIHVSRLAGFLFALIPFSVIAFAFLGWATGVVGAPALTVEGRAASLVEQMLSSVRIIQAFGMGPHIIRRLNDGMLAKLERLGLGRSIIRGIEQSAIYFVLNTSYAIAFWWGGVQVTRGAENGDVLTAFWNILNSVFAIANAVPHLAGIFDSYTALGLLRRQIERQPQIDVRDRGGRTAIATDASSATPAFELQHVTFAYPSRPHTKSLNDVSVKIERGQVTAFVGPSGSGKSTIASLFLREYDPETSNVRNPADPLPEAEQREKDQQKADDKKAVKLFRKKRQHKAAAAQSSSAEAHEDVDTSADAAHYDDLEKLEDTPIKAPKSRQRVQGGGTVFYAGQDIKSYNVRWLRSRISVVSQHPQLFTASIFENVAAGLTGTEWAFRPDIDLAEDADAATKHKVGLVRAKCEEALKKADAWNFVSKLPEGMATVVSGGRAGLLSGGQRQRIAIARALVREPEVLILDEGTSALDSATEDRIKAMLHEEQRRRGMTLILIAHRLSTIAQADKIVVLASGKVLDEGKYDELTSAKRPEGTFREMVAAQQAVINESSGKRFAIDRRDEDDFDEKHEYAGASGRRSARSPPAPLQRVATATSLTQGTTLAPTSEFSVGYGSENNDSVTPLDQRPRAAPVQDASSANKGIRPSFSGRGGMGQTEHTTAVGDGQGDALSLIASRTSALQRQDTRSSSKKAMSYKGGGGDATTGDDDHNESPINPHPDRSKSRVVLRKLFKILWAQKWFFIIGIAGAVAGGASFPIAGWMTGPAVESLSINGDNARLRSETSFWAQWFFILACADLVIFLINAFFLELASEATVRKLKVDGLAALLKQEIGFFDHEDSASGALTSAVSSHPANVGAATGLILSQVILSSTNLLGALILGLVLSWKAAIVCFAPFFVLFVSGYAQVIMLEKYEAAASKPAAKAAAYINEAMDTVRTVSALGREAETMRTFDSEARSDTRRRRFLLLGATGFGVSQGMILFLSALIFYWGGKIYADGDVSLKDLYAVFEAIIIGAFASGRLFTFVGDYTRAYSSFAILESWLGRKPRVAKIELPADAQGNKPIGRAMGYSASGEALSHPTQGDIVFTNVEMRYPQRPKYPALRCVNLHIEAGTNVAFCGTSGSGKSSMLSLLQRFYDPSKGSITFGGVDASAMTLEDLRSGMAYVSQDPILFEGSLRWNLTLGSNDPDSVTDAEIEAACEQACILDFVRNLEHGFDTDIGMKGAQLSGGQKQRLCIARALLRNAPILCLDEATSALDPTSEKAVQRALDRASVGRTTITIAHRLSTIRNADVIHVVEDGAIVESGSHDELIQRKGRYLDLVAAQI